jgi:hypothetical protein
MYMTSVRTALFIRIEEHRSCSSSQIKPYFRKMWCSSPASMVRAKSKHVIIVLNAHLKMPQDKYIEHWMFWSYNLKNLGEHITSWSCEVLGEDHITLVMDEYLSSRQGMWMDFALSISHFCKRVGQFSTTWLICYTLTTCFRPNIK